MAGIKDILTIEQSRQTIEEWKVIHLFMEGTFYRAYEVSAWLCCLYMSELKVTHKHIKGIDQNIAFVGFPVTSLEKRVPEDAEVKYLDEKHLLICLPMASVSLDIESNNVDFLEWKQKQPLTEPKENNGNSLQKNSIAKVQLPSLFSVAQQIMSYSIENHSPIDCMLFLSEIKKNISKIL